MRRMLRPSLRLAPAPALALALAAACGSPPPATVGPQKVVLPVAPGSAQPGQASGPKRESPPAPLASKESPIPPATRSELASGLRVAVVQAGALPLVHVRVLVRAGMGYGTPGAAQLTAELLKDGGTKTLKGAELLSKLESLGASLGVDVDFDKTTFSVAVTKDKLDAALALLGEMVSAPRFDETELGKLKARLSDDARENARGSGTWAAYRVVFRELFAEKSPYATYDLVPAEIARVTGATVRDFHKRFYVAKNTTVVLAGDLDAKTGAAAVEKHFKGLGGGEPPKVDFPASIPPQKRRVVVVHRPKAEQSDVLVVTLAPPRADKDWPALRVAAQVLGGGVASRLFLDVREQRSLAYSTRASMVELAHGPLPAIAYAGTRTAKTTDAVTAVLEKVGEIATSAPPTEPEVQSARRYLSDIFAVQMESVGSIAELVVKEESLSLPPGYWDVYRAELRSLEPARAAAGAKRAFDASKALVVVAGDADVVAEPLARFGEVAVVDPEKDFATIKTLPAAGQ
jgi:predicted Zn-dependent peptidase